MTGLGLEFKINSLWNEESWFDPYLRVAANYLRHDQSVMTFPQTDINGVYYAAVNGKGDLVVQIKIEYPKALTEEQTQLLEKLQESFGIESKPHEKNFENMFDKVKKWFS